MAKKRKKRLTTRDAFAAHTRAAQAAADQTQEKIDSLEKLALVDRAADDAVARGDFDFRPTAGREPFVIEIMQNHAHADSNVIKRKRTSLRYENELAEAEITELTARLDYLRSSASKNDALIEGLTSIINLRKI